MVVFIQELCNRAILLRKKKHTHICTRTVAHTMKLMIPADKGMHGKQEKT